MASYRGDPRWIEVRFDGRCAKRGCGAAIRRGEAAFYYPNGRQLFGKPCGHGDEAAADFEAHRADEGGY